MQKYRIVQHLMGENFDVFDAFQPESQNLTHQTVQKQCSIYECMQ